MRAFSRLGGARVVGIGFIQEVLHKGHGIGVVDSAAKYSSECLAL